MCAVLGVSTSGYYDWTRSKTSVRDADNAFLDQKILEIFAMHKGLYGMKRIWEALLTAGIQCSFNRLKRRYKLLELKAKVARKFKATTDSGHNHPVAPNLLNRDFTATAPNQKWVSDITYIPTQQGWMYLAVVIDLYSRSVVGWAMSHRINQELVCNALTQALWRRGFPKDVIVHTDRGSQYCSKRYQRLLKANNLVCSMSRKGNCWDNAVAESFFKTIKSELVYQTRYQSRDHARQDIFEYIETYYNKVRIHSALDYKTPSEVECRYLVAA